MNVIRKPPKDVHAFTDASNDKGYFTITPRIVLAMCRNPFDYTLWSVVKDIAGEQRECYIGAKNLGKLAMMSPGQVQNSRAYLLRVRLLCGEKQFNESTGHDVWHLWIPDLWAENLKWCEEYRTIESRIAFKSRQSTEPANPLQPALIEQALPFMDEESGDDASTTPKHSVPCHSTEYHDIALSITPDDDSATPKHSVPCGSVKEEQALTEEEQEEKSIDASQEFENIWTKALESLSLQMTTTTFDTHLKHTMVWKEKCNGKLVVVLSRPKYGSLEWVNGRLRPMIERAVKAAAGREVAIEFVARKKKK